MGEPLDAVIVGGGHNGLVAAAYLARAGLRVRVLERRPAVGGAVATVEFHPGFRNSLAAYTVSLLDPGIIRDLGLARHGLTIVERRAANFLPEPDGPGLLMADDPAERRAEVARLSPRDAEALGPYGTAIERSADLVRGLARRAPPPGIGTAADAVTAVSLAARAMRLDRADRQTLIDLVTKSAGDLLRLWFDSDLVQAGFGFDAVVGSYQSPFDSGTGYVLLHHCFGEVNGRRGAWGHALGGMGAIAQAMAAAAAEAGAAIETEAEVARVLVEDGRAVGAELVDGRSVRARRVVANVDPKRLYLGLVEPGALPDSFRRRIEGYRMGSASFRLNLALSRLPRFAGRPAADDAALYTAGIICAPSLAYMDRAYVTARATGLSDHPIVELVIPSTLDDSLAPPGAHVASLFCQHVDPDLPDGRSWDEMREAAADRAIDTVEAVAPGFRDSVIARQVLTPADLERDLGLTRGDIFHGCLSFDQLWTGRPVPGHAQYRGPLEGLYLCGSGAHPGGGVTGLPGRNAAHAVLADRRRRR